MSSVSSFILFQGDANFVARTDPNFEDLESGQASNIAFSDMSNPHEDASVNIETLTTLEGEPITHFYFMLHANDAERQTARPEDAGPTTMVTIDTIQVREVIGFNTTLLQPIYRQDIASVEACPARS